jgi:hypothetical protein
VKDIKRFQFLRWVEFREAVTAAQARPSLPTGRYTYYDETFGSIADLFQDPLAEGVQLRRPLNDDISSELGALAKEVVLSSMLAHTPLEPYFSVVHILRDSLNGKGAIPTISATDNRWIDAIQIALTYRERRDMQWATANHPQPADVTFAHAVRFFNKKNINVGLIGDQILVSSNCVWSALSDTAVAPMMVLGDTAAIKQVDRWLQNKFDPLVRRFHLHPTPDLMGRKLDRSVPLGHLYRAAIKTLGRRPGPSKIRVKESAIAEAATHFAALYEVEPFTTYETMFPPYPRRVLEMLLRVVLYDELFAVPQCDPEHMELLMLSLFAEVSKADASVRTGWKFNDAVVLWKILLAVSTSDAASTFIDRSNLERFLAQNIGVAASEALLNDFALSEPNRRYRVPSDAALADTRECAIAKASGQRYWIAPRPFLGPAFFSRLVGHYARVDKEASNKIGIAFETHMLDRLAQLGISCRRADIEGSTGFKGGDIDLIVETPEIVALFEMKKKGLTRKTNAGNEVQLAVDLARGVVRGFNQLARHELTLLRSGELRFSDGTALYLSGRRLIKCVVSLADYGGLHDGAVVRNMLHTFSQVTLSPGPSLTGEQLAHLKEANEQLRLLQSRYKDFVTLYPDDPQANPFDNFLFHNVFFVEHLLLSARTADGFLQALLMGHRVVTGSRDPFFDHERLRPLRI